MVQLHWQAPASVALVPFERIDPSRGFALGSRPSGSMSPVRSSLLFRTHRTGVSPTPRRECQSRAVRRPRTAPALEKIQVKDGATADGYGALSQIVLTFLDSRLSDKIKGLTHQQMKDVLRKDGLDESLIAGLIETLEAADFARFARAGDAGDLKASIARAGELVNHIDKAVS